MLNFLCRKFSKLTGNEVVAYSYNGTLYDTKCKMEDARVNHKRSIIKSRILHNIECRLSLEGITEDIWYESGWNPIGREGYTGILGLPSRDKVILDETISMLLNTKEDIRELVVLMDKAEAEGSNES